MYINLDDFYNINIYFMKEIAKIELMKQLQKYNIFIQESFYTVIIKIFCSISLIFLNDGKIKQFFFNIVKALFNGNYPITLLLNQRNSRVIILMIFLNCNISYVIIIYYRK